MNKEKTKKDYVNFNCKLDSEIAKQLDEYSVMTKLSKTSVVEIALQDYFRHNCVDTLATYYSIIYVMGVTGSTVGLLPEMYQSFVMSLNNFYYTRAIPSHDETLIKECEDFMHNIFIKTEKIDATPEQSAKIDEACEYAGRRIQELLRQ